MVDIEKFEINQCIHVPIFMHMCIFMLPTASYWRTPHAFLCGCEYSCGEMLWSLVGKKGEQGQTRREPICSCLLPGNTYIPPILWLISGRLQAHGSFLAWFQNCWAKGLIGRSLDCSTCFGHAPACDREANCPHHHMGWVLIPAAHLQGWLA